MARTVWLAGLWTAVLLYSESADAGKTVIYTVGYTFSPRSVTVLVGESVQWIIATTHNVVETTGANCNPAPSGFMSGLTVNDVSVRSYTHTFNEVGVYYYMCNPHCAEYGMRGTITVVPALDGGPADGEGGDGDAFDGGDPAPSDDGDTDWERFDGPYGGGCGVSPAGIAPMACSLALVLLRRRRRI